MPSPRRSAPRSGRRRSAGRGTPAGDRAADATLRPPARADRRAPGALVGGRGGALADRYGSGKVLVAGILILAAGTALTPFMTSGFGLIVVARRLLAAIGSGAGSFSVLIGAAAQRLHRGGARQGGGHHQRGRLVRPVRLRAGRAEADPGVRLDGRAVDARADDARGAAARAQSGAAVMRSRARRARAKRRCGRRCAAR